MEMESSVKTFLTIDTATDILYVHVMKDGRPVFEHQEKGHKDHAVKLLPTLIKALESSGLKGPDLDGILIGVGPGSYTGVRMGVVVAKMWAKEWDIPLFEISTLALMASAKTNPTVVMIDARNQHVFAGAYDFSRPEPCLLKPGYYSRLFLAETYPEMDALETFNPNLEIILNAQAYEKVKSIDDLTPDYVRKTQAEKERHDS